MSVARKCVAPWGSGFGVRPECENSTMHPDLEGTSIDQSINQEERSWSRVSRDTVCGTLRFDSVRREPINLCEEVSLVPCAKRFRVQEVLGSGCTVR